MLQDLLPSEEMDVGSMEETLMVAPVEVRAFRYPPLLHLDELKQMLGEALGQCCGKPFTGDCGGYSGGKPALEHYRDGLFGEPHVTEWIRKIEYILKSSKLSIL